MTTCAYQRIANFDQLKSDDDEEALPHIPSEVLLAGECIAVKSMGWFDESVLGEFDDVESDDIDGPAGHKLRVNQDPSFEYVSASRGTYGIEVFRDLQTHDEKSAYMVVWLWHDYRELKCPNWEENGSKNARFDFLRIYTIMKSKLSQSQAKKLACKMQKAIIKAKEEDRLARTIDTHGMLCRGKIGQSVSEENPNVGSPIHIGDLVRLVDNDENSSWVWQIKSETSRHPVGDEEEYYYSYEIIPVFTGLFTSKNIKSILTESWMLKPVKLEDLARKHLEIQNLINQFLHLKVQDEE